MFKFIFEFDTWVENLFLIYRAPEITQFMQNITWIGAPEVAAIFVIAIALILKNQKKSAIYFVAAFILTEVLVFVGKIIIQRDRPNGEPFSFPSGHAATAAFFFGLIIYQILRSKTKLAVKIFLTILLLLLIILIDISRLYLGVHFFSDVIVGNAIGFLMLFGMIVVITKLDKTKIKQVR